jgi:hypothetical protein
MGGLTLCGAVCLRRLRTSRKLWNITERDESVTEDCYSYTIGSDLLVVLTNRGSNLGNATKTCSITLPANSPLLRKGLTGVQDVLDFQQVLIGLTKAMLMPQLPLGILRA